ncbi:MAG: hypothetical protein ACHQUC_01670 [Chlamydiales bacterium]
MQIFILLLVCLSSCFSIRAEEQKTIGIFTFFIGGTAPWDPDDIKKGITGSEEAVIYISQELANLGYKVFVLGNPPENSPYSKPDSNPQYINFKPAEDAIFDIGIAWRLPELGKKIQNHARKIYLWPHDICIFNEGASEINAFADILWLSKWQRINWIAKNPAYAKFNNIYGNAILPTQFQEVEERKNPYSCIYGSNYARGLEILLDIWPDIKQAFPRATLDIYYGWQHWGQLTRQKELKMRAQVYLLGPLDVTDHGLVSHETLNQAYARASFWTYPCVLPETFCITALRAQLSGAVPVIIEGSALNETVRHGYKCANQEAYFKTLAAALQNAEKIKLDDRKKMGEFIQQEYTWEAVAKKWKETFESNCDSEKNEV